VNGLEWITRDSCCASANFLGQLNIIINIIIIIIIIIIINFLVYTLCSTDPEG